MVGNDEEERDQRERKADESDRERMVRRAAARERGDHDPGDSEHGHPRGHDQAKFGDSSETWSPYDRRDDEGRDQGERCEAKVRRRLRGERIKLQRALRDGVPREAVESVRPQLAGIVALAVGEDIFDCTG